MEVSGTGGNAAVAAAVVDGGEVAELEMLTRALVGITLESLEVLGGEVSLPLASVSAYALSTLVLKRSVLTEKVARRGIHLTREYSTDPLEVFFAREVMTPTASPPLIPSTSIRATPPPM